MARFNPDTVAIVIPARYGSTRLQQKPLRLLCGEPLLWWAWRAARDTGNASLAFVATDATEIVTWCNEKRIPVLLDTVPRATGTDRVSEAIADHKFFGTSDRRAQYKNLRFVVNLQCDEPQVTAKDLDRLIAHMWEHRVQTCVTYAYETANLHEPNRDVVKVLIDRDDRAIYFSRHPLPTRHRHVGVYGFGCRTLESFVNLPRPDIEYDEELEQLRLIENGIPIKVLHLGREVRGINTEADLAWANEEKIMDVTE